MIGERFIQVDKTSKIPNGEVKNILEYKKWQKFINVIENAKIVCEKNNYNVLDHFTQVGKMVGIGFGAKRKQVDYELSRYACYLIVHILELIKRKES